MTKCQNNAIGHGSKDELGGYVPPAAGATGRPLFISTTRPISPPISANAGYDTSRNQNHASCHQRKSPMLFHVSSAIDHYIAVLDSPPSNALSSYNNRPTNPRGDDDVFTADFFKGFATIAGITLLYASLSPLWYVVFQGNNPPPPLFLNAAVSVVALVGILLSAPCLDDIVGKPSLAPPSSSFFFHGSGTTAHVFGMSLTTANHGAFLLQMTTLIVPVLQGLRGAEKIPVQIQLSVALAFAGIVAFTQDTGSSSSSSSSGGGSGSSQADELDPVDVEIGDALMLAAAFVYSLYDIQTYYWGREIPRTELVTIQVGFQAIFSCILCLILSRKETAIYFANTPAWNLVISTILWSGLIVNALATFLQVGGMLVVGPTRAQLIFASQPLWASILNFVFLGELMGPQGLVGGGAFLLALVLAVTAEAPVVTSPTTAITRKEKNDPVEFKRSSNTIEIT